MGFQTLRDWTTHLFSFSFSFSSFFFLLWMYKKSKNIYDSVKDTKDHDI